MGTRGLIGLGRLLVSGLHRDDWVTRPTGAAMALSGERGARRGGRWTRERRDEPSACSGGSSATAVDDAALSLALGAFGRKKSVLGCPY